MNNAELTVIIEEALRRESDLPISRRILLYRGLASLCGDMPTSTHFRALASALETTERRCREFRFELPAQTPPSTEQTAKMAV